MAKKSLVLFVCLFFSAGLFAQSAEKVSELVGTDKATYGQVAYFAGCALGVINDSASYSETVSRFQQAGIIREGVSADSVIPLKDVAFIVMHTWKMKQCLMYKACRDPRYALKTLKANGIVANSADPKKVSSGHEILFIISDCVDRYPMYDASVYF